MSQETNSGLIIPGEITVDNDWKEQAQKEKAKMAAEASKKEEEKQQEENVVDLDNLNVSHLARLLMTGAMSGLATQMINETQVLINFELAELHFRLLDVLADNLDKEKVGPEVFEEINQIKQVIAQRVIEVQAALEMAEQQQNNSMQNVAQPNEIEV